MAEINSNPVLKTLFVILIGCVVGVVLLLLILAAKELFLLNSNRTQRELDAIAEQSHKTAGTQRQGQSIKNHTKVKLLKYKR